MYKYFDKNENDDISLHDCRATSILFSRKKLTFTFPDGFWVGETNNQNPYGKALCTDESVVEFKLLHEDITIYIFTEEKDKTIREEWELKEFADRINKRTWELEFLYSYKGYHSIIFECMIWFDEAPYSKECVLIISTDDITYGWNDICENKTW